MFSNTQIMIHERMVTALLGAWRRVRRVKKPCSLSLLSASAGNSCTLSLQDPDDISLLDADSTSCGTKFSLLLLLWLTFMPFPPPSSMMSSLSLSLSLSVTQGKTRLCSFLCLAWDFVIVSQKPGKVASKHTLKEVQDWTVLFRAFVNDTKKHGKVFHFHR